MTDLSGIARYEKLEDMIADKTLDMIDICLPPAWHADAAVAALKAGKHVFCEKPIALAAACGRRVLTGPVEATAIGNLLMQAISDGAISSIADARAVVHDSFPVEEYLPRDTAAWDEVYERFEKVIGG